MTVSPLDPPVGTLHNKLGAFSLRLGPTDLLRVGLAVEDPRRPPSSVLLHGPAPVRPRLNGDVEAESHYDAAATLARRMGARPYLASIQVAWAELLAHRGAEGDRERALALLDEALPIATEIGMALVRARAERLRADLGRD